jgi:hypothetical protein
MTPVPALAAIGFGELDAVAFNFIDRANMNAVRADHFHMFFYFRHLLFSLNEA